MNPATDPGRFRPLRRPGRSVRPASVGALCLVLVFAAAAPASGQPVSFNGPTNLPVGLNPSSVAVGDFNGDSDPDLAVANAGSDDVSILLGAAGGSFTGPTNFAAGAAPVAVAAGDFNGDSDPDLAVANSHADNVSILLGAAGGHT